jgi:uncharacterized protein (DUF849 family)
MAKGSRKVIITCAITGGIHTPTMSPHLPVAPNQIAEEAIGAAEAGAAILHLRARNPDEGRHAVAQGRRPGQFLTVEIDKFAKTPVRPLG